MENNRNVFFFYPEAEQNQPRKVVAGIFNPETNVIIVGKSQCSTKDKFDKAKGRAIALGRAQCQRPLREKAFLHKGEVVSSNKDLLPTAISVNPAVSPLTQFIDFAKTL